MLPFIFSKDVSVCELAFPRGTIMMPFSFSWSISGAGSDGAAAVIIILSKVRFSGQPFDPSAMQNSTFLMFRPARTVWADSDSWLYFSMVQTFLASFARIAVW